MSTSRLAVCLVGEISTQVFAAVGMWWVFAHSFTNTVAVAIACVFGTVFVLVAIAKVLVDAGRLK